MLARIGVVVGGILAVVAVLLGIWFLGMRTKAPAVLDFQRRVNKRVFNPRQLRSAGTPGAYAAVIRHVGRRSGAPYETPIVPLPTDDGFVIVLPYGTRPDWVRNVVAAGSATLVHEGETIEVVAPEVITVDGAPYDFPASERRNLRLFGNTQCLRVRRAPVAAGS
ncbi:MAG: nitroreductase family deazaflavin-dependent oxidoreductase [Acidimicrobiales bacterium]|nr:nitroreductase family deazaflavin-dependent oxidoreductase [Acidimicrobiales bacterium]